MFLCQICDHLYPSISLLLFTVTVHALRKQQRILPMLRIPNRQNLLPPRYHTAFSVQKMPTRVQVTVYLHHTILCALFHLTFCLYPI